MSTSFPGALDALNNPAPSDGLIGHASQHANANDAIEALQAKVGINGSAVATSLDYRISTAETGLDGKISSSEKGSANGVATLGFDGKVPSSQLPPLDYIPTSEKGAAGGVAGLDEAGKVPAAQLPSYVDDVLEYANLAAFPVTGEAGKIYIALDTNKVYRWSGSTYVYITSGSVDSVAGKTGVVSLVKADVGLGNVDNTTDANKPISTATQTALNGKASSSHVGATGTAHGVATTSVAGFMSDTDKSKLDGVATGANNYTHPSGDGNLHVPATGTTNSGKVLKAGATAGSLSWGTLAKADVGLSNVDNTADVAKPISTAQQTALDLKAPLNSPALTGTASITANTSTPALTITQTGTGYALLVEDSASPDSTPFVIDQTGNVGIGVSPSYGLDVSSTIRAVTGFSMTADGSYYEPYGAAAIPNYGIGSPSANWVGLSGFSGLAFYTSQGERMRIDAYGNVGVGMAPIASTAKIQSNGDIGLTGANRSLLLNVYFSGGWKYAANGYAGFIKSDDTGGGGLSIAVLPLNSSGAGAAATPLNAVKITTAGNLEVITPALLGYGTGAGGTVTQATSKSTAVTLNKPTGQITMNNAALAAGASVEFVINNGLVSTLDVVTMSVSEFPNYLVSCKRVASGGFVARLTNTSAGSLSEAVVINFAIIKGSSA